MENKREQLPFVQPRAWNVLQRILLFSTYILGMSFLAFACHKVLTRFGFDFFLMALVGALLGIVYLVISFKSLMVPFLVWILSLGGFRFIWSIQTPGLPDLFIDRICMVLLTIMFMVKFFSSGRSLRGPWPLDILILCHGLYLFVRVYTGDMKYFHDFTMSVMVPYGGYFFAKNIVNNEQKIRKFLVALLALSVYYSITSVAEKFNIDALLWPKYMAEGTSYFVNRSSGPFLHAPLFGTIIGMLLPINLYFLATTRGVVVKSLLLMNLSLGFAALYFTYTRGSWLAGIVALFVVALLNHRYYLRYFLPVLVLLPIVALFFLGIQDDKFLKERVENEDTLGSRVATAITAVRVWQDNPLFGCGFFYYKEVRGDYIESINAPGLGTIRFSQFRHNSIHDIYLGKLAEDGLVGMSMQVLVYFLIFRVSMSQYRRRKKGDHYAEFILPVLVGIFVGYMVGGIAIDYRYFAFVGTLFYASAGILYGQNEIDLGAEKDAAQVGGLRGDYNVY